MLYPRPSLVCTRTSKNVQYNISSLAVCVLFADATTTLRFLLQKHQPRSARPCAFTLSVAAAIVGIYNGSEKQFEREERPPAETASRENLQPECLGDKRSRSAPLSDFPILARGNRCVYPAYTAWLGSHSHSVQTRDGDVSAKDICEPPQYEL
jgi:hypothetical protein